ncbi:DUF3662 and FHA domain-containing protein, partial [Leucobacter sp. M11]|uniref:DUF3662 and FHA domain-containing protein n=1 Tax=Leucobacter sp. M11 TaxID=2993565 RepID=UPI002D7EF400
VIVDRDRVLTPNSFSVRVSSQDYERLSGLGQTLPQELRAVVHKHAKRQGYRFLGPVVIDIVDDPGMTPGVLQVDASRVSNEVNWLAVLDVNGARHPLRRGTTVIGRGSDADITISDSGASRAHLEITWDGAKGTARDLGSTNGSKINGQRFREAALIPDTVLTIGKTSLRFSLIPESPRPERPAPAEPSDHTVVQPAVDQDFWRDL